jgi:glycosyltransferase involved in cell wall biosynthesis
MKELNSGPHREDSEIPKVNLLRKMMKILVAIPAYNEQESIADVIAEVKIFLPEATILVVNDGSHDKTALRAERSGARVISLPFNVGVGGALRAAFKYAARNEFSHVIQIDADGQHLPSEARKLIDLSQEDSVVIGSRFLDSNSQYVTSFARRLAMYILAGITSLICRTKLTDVTSGFRVASGKAIDLFAREYPSEYLGDTVESLIIAHRANIKIAELPVIMKQREFGMPSQNLIKSSWYLFRALLIIIFALFKQSNNKN